MRRVLIVLLALVVIVAALLYFQQSPPPKPPAATIVTPSPAPSPVEKPDPVATALKTALDKGSSYDARILALRKLINTNHELSAEDKNRFRELAKSRDTNPFLRNDCLQLLESRKNRVAQLGSDITGMWEKRDTDPKHAAERVWADYLLQHMAHVYVYADNRKEILRILFSEARKASSADGKVLYSGTAMLALQRLARIHPAIARRVNEIATKTLESPAKDYNKTVTAFQIARKNKDQKVLGQARQVAQDVKALARARMSACGYIGELGTTADLALLKRLTADQESRVQRVARYNLKILRKRLEKTAAGG